MPASCPRHGLTAEEHCDHMEEMLEEVPGDFCEGEGDQPKDAVERLRLAYEEAVAFEGESRPLKKDEPHGRALVLIMHGKGLVLTWDGDEGVDNWISDCRSGSTDTFPCAGCLDYNNKLADGLYIGELGWQNEGPSDWPGGGNEYSLAFDKARLATAEEWQHHIDGEWPWEPMHEDATS